MAAASRLPADFTRDAPCLVGVSGGRDSIALAHWLHAAGFRRLIISHLDHGLRTASSAEAEFVRQFARELGCEFVSKRVRTADHAKRRKLSTETAARELRYAFFAEVARERNTPRLVLAHHADDQVETFLLQLLRGAGPGGLGGMSSSTTREINGIELTIARPLLGVWRTEIDAYITQHSLRYCEDPSNTQLQPTRNRIRHIALPALCEAFGRDTKAAIWRAAELLRAEDEAMSALIDQKQIGESLAVEPLRALPVALQRRCIHAWLRIHGVEDAGFEEVESVRALLHDPRKAKANLAGDRCARRQAKRLFLDQQ
jgi:tRNA(Ile)-lysidine synthase